MTPVMDVLWSVGLADRASSSNDRSPFLNQHQHGRCGEHLRNRRDTKYPLRRDRRSGRDIGKPETLHEDCLGVLCYADSTTGSTRVDLSKYPVDTPVR